MKSVLAQLTGALAILSAPLVAAAPMPYESIPTKNLFTSTLDISELSVFEPTTEANSYAKLNFTVTAGNVQTHCGGQWAAGNGYPASQYVSCNNGTFGWKFETNSFASLNQFTLDVSYNSRDDSLGKAPYNMLTEFAKADVTPKDLSCSTSDNGRLCQQGNEKLIAKVFESIAK